MTRQILRDHIGTALAVLSLITAGLMFAVCIYFGGSNV